MAASGESCVSLWRGENDELVRRWRRVTRSPGPGCSVAETAQQCRLAFTKLLQKIQGLPAVLPALPLELTILYNSLLFDIHLSSSSDAELLAGIDYGLTRVLEAYSVPDHSISPEGRWKKLLQEGASKELQAALHQLAALQAALWLVTNRLEAVEDLFRILTGAKDLEPSPCSSHQNELLSLLQTWRPQDSEEYDPLVAQSVRDLKEILWTSAAFLQGIQQLEAGNSTAALAFFKAAAAGLSSKRVLAQTFTLMGCCNLRLGKPQVALQHLRRALQVDFTFLPALHQAALLYRQLELLEAELESLALLYQALDGPMEVTSESVDPHFLIRIERLIRSAQRTPFFAQKCPAGVKYLLAQRCLQAGRAGEAAEHYLDLLAMLQEGPLPQVCQSKMPVLPRIPEVFLEAASALEELAKHEDALVVCEEVVTRTSLLVPKKLRLGPGLNGDEDVLWAKSPGTVQEQRRESLCCILWRAAAHVIQGWACGRLGEAKEAISHFSRSLDDLLRIHFVSADGACNSSAEEEWEKLRLSEMKILPQIRQLALTGRGAQFLELGRDKEALMDFQHSLHVCPDSPSANWYLVHTLWKLGRRKEAAAHWQKFVPKSAPMDEKAEGSFPLYLQSCARQMKFPQAESLIKNMEGFLGGKSLEP
ncbi:Fanconi anemia group G protein [Anolis carolinensis]|uniref:Fanconi anemia group G protein n=1 Tax=Anolis carolinensis TaxID=28377 RepID=UPI002F2B62FC